MVHFSSFTEDLPVLSDLLGIFHSGGQQIRSFKGNMVGNKKDSEVSSI